MAPPLTVGHAATSERKPWVASTVAPHGHGPTQSFPNTWEPIIYMSIDKALKSLTRLTLPQNFLNWCIQGASLEVTTINKLQNSQERQVVSEMLV